MEIVNLKLFVAEAELNDLARRHLPPSDTVEDLRIGLTPEGIVVSGEYPAMMFKVPFETLWRPSVAGPEVQVRLESVKVAGLPAGLLKGALLRVIADAVEKEPGVKVQEEAVRVHLEEAARAQGVSLRINLTEVRCGVGGLVLEAGPAAESAPKAPGS